MRPIDPRVHQALDGEIARESLPPELALQAARLEAAAAVLGAVVPEGTRSIEARVMAAIRRPAPSRMWRLARWLARPQSITLRIRPAWSLAVAAVVALVTLLPAGDEAPTVGEQEGIAQFVAPFPGASSVHVVGSFNDWRTGTIPLHDPDRDGVWRVAVVLPAGDYEYMFVVDGERWVPDHLADRTVEDDFGRENSVVIVRPAAR
jgi:hypothetical protein